MGNGVAAYHRYIRQQRAMGRSPSREDKAAFLQGDIQAKLALGDQTRRTSLEERRIQGQEDFREKQLGLQKEGLDQRESEFDAQFGLERDRHKFQKKSARLAGYGQLAQLGIAAMPHLKKAGSWVKDTATEWFGDVGGGDYDAWSGYGAEEFGEMDTDFWAQDSGSYEFSTDFGSDFDGGFKTPAMEFDTSWGDWGDF